MCGSRFESYLAQFHSRCGDAFAVRPLSPWLINKLAGGPPNFRVSDEALGPYSVGTASSAAGAFKLLRVVWRPLSSFQSVAPSRTRLLRVM